MRKWCLALAFCAASMAAFAQADLKQQLMQVDRDFCKATQEKRLEGWMDYMDDEGVLFRGKPVVGKEAVRAEIKGEWADPNFHLSWEPEDAYPLPGGKTGYTRGRWELTSQDKDGKPFKLTGEYLTVWRKNPKGDWKIIWDGGAANPPKK